MMRAVRHIAVETPSGVSFLFCELPYSAPRRTSARFVKRKMRSKPKHFSQGKASARRGERSLLAGRIEDKAEYSLETS
jgi:hypothetical protein